MPFECTHHMRQVDIRQSSGIELIEKETTERLTYLDEMLDLGFRNAVEGEDLDQLLFGIAEDLVDLLSGVISKIKQRASSTQKEVNL
mgnify:CR=1 FL=1